MNYLNARYYDGNRGRFISIDPMFWSPEKFLMDPQSLNAYSYARNNPIIFQDSNGQYIESFIDVGFIIYDVYELAKVYAEGGDTKEQLSYLGLDVAGLAIPGATGLGLAGRTAARAAKVASVAGDGMKAVDKVSDGVKIISASEKTKDIIKAGDTIAGLRVTKHAENGFKTRNIIPEQIPNALRNGEKYLDLRDNTLLHTIGERGKGGHTIVTDLGQKSLVSVEDFIRKLKPERFKNLKDIK